MKKLVLTFTFFISFTALFAGPPLTVYKQRKGLFGYRTVTENSNAEAHTLFCQDPGFIGCRPHSISDLVDDDGVPMSEELYFEIDNHIYDKINESHTSGSIVWDNRFFITYRYDVDSDLMSTTFYTLSQARELGLINF